MPVQFAYVAAAPPPQPVAGGWGFPFGYHVAPSGIPFHVPPPQPVPPQLFYSTAPPPTPYPAFQSPPPPPALPAASYFPASGPPARADFYYCVPPPPAAAPHSHPQPLPSDPAIAALTSGRRVRGAPPARAPWDAAALQWGRKVPGPGAYEVPPPTSKITFNAKLCPNPDMPGYGRFEAPPLAHVQARLAAPSLRRDARKEVPVPVR